MTIERIAEQLRNIAHNAGRERLTRLANGQTLDSHVGAAMLDAENQCDALAARFEALVRSGQK